MEIKGGREEVEDEVIVRSFVRLLVHNHVLAISAFLLLEEFSRGEKVRISSRRSIAVTVRLRVNKTKLWTSDESQRVAVKRRRVSQKSHFVTEKIRSWAGVDRWSVGDGKGNGKDVNKCKFSPFSCLYVFTLSPSSPLSDNQVMEGGLLGNDEGIK